MTKYKAILTGLTALWAHAALAVDVQVQGVVLTFPDPVVPFIATTDTKPIEIPSGTSLRLIWPSEGGDEFAATIDVSPMSADLSLKAFWPEYVQGIQEETGGAAVEERDWERGALHGKTAEATTRDQSDDAFGTKAYMLAMKGGDAYISIELQIAKEQNVKEIERQIDLALTKAKPVEKAAR